MRWDALFDDLAAQAQAIGAHERALEARDRARIEVAALTMIDRLRPSIGAVVRMRCVGGMTVNGLLLRTGGDWLLVRDSTAVDVLVRSEGVVSVVGATRFASAAEGVVQARLDARHVLRAVARDRSAVTVHLIDGSAISGTIDRVGADYLDVALHAVGEDRRHHAVREIVVVLIRTIVVVRRRG